MAGFILDSCKPLNHLCLAAAVGAMVVVAKVNVAVVKVKAVGARVNVVGARVVVKVVVGWEAGPLRERGTRGEHAGRLSHVIACPSGEDQLNHCAVTALS